MNKVIDVKKLTKEYKKLKAVDNLSFEVYEGEILGLLGPNGSGKSTMMNIIAGLLKPTEGVVLYNGDEIKKSGIAYRSKIGYMPQYPAMYPSFSVMEFLLYMAELKGLAKGTEREQIEYLLDKVELSDVTDRRISALSGGMKQRLSLCSAVLGDPEILILDEPTAGLDPKQRVSLRKFISEISTDKTVLWATHIVSDVESIASEIIFVKKGIATAVPHNKDDKVLLEDKYISFFGDLI